MTPAELHEVTLRWLNRRLLIVVVCLSAGVALIVGLVTALVVAHQANAGFHRVERTNANLERINAVESCDGVNLLRGHDRLKSSDKRSDVLLRIRDCPATYDRGRIVVLSRREERVYLLALAHQHRVAARHGRRGQLVLVPIR